MRKIPSLFRRTEDGRALTRDLHPLADWVAAGERPEDKWIREAAGEQTWQDGTYEACGPRIGDNPEGLLSHVLIRHGDCKYPDAPRTFEGLVQFFRDHPKVEGVVWWRDRDNVDCDKVKITAEVLGVE